MWTSVWKSTNPNQSTFSSKSALHQILYSLNRNRVWIFNHQLKKINVSIWKNKVKTGGWACRAKTIQHNCNFTWLPSVESKSLSLFVCCVSIIYNGDSFCDIVNALFANTIHFFSSFIYHWNYFLYSITLGISSQQLLRQNSTYFFRKTIRTDLRFVFFSETHILNNSVIFMLNRCIICRV